MAKDNKLVKREHKPSKVKAALKSFWKKGPIFKFLTYVVQISAFGSVAYGIGMAMATTLLSDVVQSFGAYAVSITGAENFGQLLLGDLFGFFMLPSAFVMLALLAGYIAFCAAVWRGLAKWMGRLRAKREAYGVGKDAESQVASE